jgi:hypothetical protein
VLMASIEMRTLKSNHLALVLQPNQALVSPTL